MDYQFKEVILASVGVLALLGILAGIIGFFWYKISDDRQQRSSVRESDEYKAVERSSSGWKQLYEVTLVQKENLERELASTIKRLEDAEREATNAQRRITMLLDNLSTLQQRIEVLEKYSLTHKPLAEN